jgi:hypothetical protein
VEFEAIRGPSYHADIALDDIYFRETPCGKTIEIALIHVVYTTILLYDDTYRLLLVQCNYRWKPKLNY